MIGRFRFWALALLGAASDLSSKALVFAELGHPGPDARVADVVPGFLQLRTALNPGGAWGMGRELSGALPAIRVAAVGFLVYLFHKVSASGRLFLAGIGLVLGGAIGNAWDGVVHGAVRDFVECDLGFMRWPTFNLADALIGLGAALVLAHLVFDGPRLRPARELPRAGGSVEERR